MTQPNFMIIGAQKSGTKWLSYNLRMHPEVFIYPYEIHYFNLLSNYEKGVSWYERHFDEAERYQCAIGEKTPNYLWITDEDVVTPFGTHRANLHRSVFGYAPNAKLIVMLRDPVHRAISAVNHYVRQGQLSPKVHIDEYLVGGAVALADRYGVRAMGHYDEALNAYFELYSREQFHFLFFERDVVENPAQGLQKTCEFLGIDQGYDFSEQENKANEFYERQIGYATLAHARPGMRRHLRRIERRIPDSASRLLFGPPLQKQRPSDAAVEQLAKYYAVSNLRLFELLDVPPQPWTGV